MHYYHQLFLKNIQRFQDLRFDDRKNGYPDICFIIFFLRSKSAKLSFQNIQWCLKWPAELSWTLVGARAMSLLSLFFSSFLTRYHIAVFNRVVPFFSFSRIPRFISRIPTSVPALYGRAVWGALQPRAPAHLAIDKYINDHCGAARGDSILRHGRARADR